jgi:hypothetical protein
VEVGTRWGRHGTLAGGLFLAGFKLPELGSNATCAELQPGQRGVRGGQRRTAHGGMWQGKAPSLR